jgi:hypothetical protein
LLVVHVLPHGHDPVERQQPHAATTTTTTPPRFETENQRDLCLPVSLFEAKKGDRLPDFEFY